MKNTLENNIKKQEKNNKLEQRHNKKTISAGSKIKKEIGGRGGLDPARFGDWEKNGRCIDF
jgi:hypothetical protein